MATFNISTKAIQESATLHLRDPETDELLYADEAEKLPLQIVLFGKASKAYRKALSELSRKNDHRKKKATFEENVADNENLLAAISLKAINFDNAGEPIDTTEAFKKLYSTPSLYWVKDQVSAFLEATDSFSTK